MNESESQKTASERARRAAQRQLDAYNAHDIDAFIACYHPEVEVRDQRSGEILMAGRDEMRSRYEVMFKSFPDVHAAVATRMVVGPFAFDRETVTGRGEDVLEVVAIYEVDAAELITRVWFAR